MGLLDALKKASEAKEVKLTTKIVSQALAEAVAEQLEEKHPKVTRPKLVFVPSKGIRKTESSFICEACGKDDICLEVGKLLLCETSCASKELEALKQVEDNPKDTSKSNGIWQPSIDKQKETIEVEPPSWAKGNDRKYWDFFNRNYDIDLMTDEQLRDSIIEDGSILFEVKTRQLKKVISFNERVAKRTKEEREKLRLGDLTYIPEQSFSEEKSPIEQVRKQRNKVQQAEDALAKLGLGGDDLKKMLTKFKVK